MGEGKAGGIFISSSAAVLSGGISAGWWCPWTKVMVPVSKGTSECGIHIPPLPSTTHTWLSAEARCSQPEGTNSSAFLLLLYFVRIFKISRFSSLSREVIQPKSCHFFTYGAFTDTEPNRIATKKEKYIRINKPEIAEVM